MITPEQLSVLRAFAATSHPQDSVKVSAGQLLELLNVYADYQPMVKQRDHFREKAKAAEYALANIRERVRLEVGDYERQMYLERNNLPEFCEQADGYEEGWREATRLASEEAEAARAALAEPYKP